MRKAGTFPPAVVYGPDGKPWHSWRVLILPYLGQNDLYRSYDFNQPWDSPKNRKLLDRMPDVYREPAYGEAKGSFAHYAALVGEDTCFPSKRPTRPDDMGGRGMMHITDGSSNSMMVAPVEPGRKIPWTKPEDIVVGPDFPGLGKPGGIATPYTLGGKPGAVRVAPILFAELRRPPRPRNHRPTHAQRIPDGQRRRGHHPHPGRPFRATNDPCDPTESRLRPGPRHPGTSGDQGAEDPGRRRQDDRRDRGRPGIPRSTRANESSEKGTQEETAAGCPR